MVGETMTKAEANLKVSFGYQCSDKNDVSKGVNIPRGGNKLHKTSSFSCLSGAALNICNGVIGEEIFPSWDSPNSFRRIPSSPSFSKLDILSSSLQSSTMSNLSWSPTYLSESNSVENDSYLFKPMNAPSRNEGFLNAMELQVAGGAAGEERVQAVCSEDNGWLFCGIYDGFNGRDADNFLAGTLYDTIVHNFNTVHSTFHVSDSDEQYVLDDNDETLPMSEGGLTLGDKPEKSHNSCQQEVLDGLHCALGQAENDFLYMVEQEMDDRPDLVSVGSCATAWE